MGDHVTTPTGWDQREDPAVDSPVLGAIALVIAVLGAVAACTYFYSPLAYVGAVVALPLAIISRGVPRSRRLGACAVVLALVACVVATVILVLGN